MIDPDECPECLGLGTCPDCLWGEDENGDCSTCGGFYVCPECDGTGVAAAKVDTNTETTR